MLIALIVFGVFFVAAYHYFQKLPGKEMQELWKAVAEDLGLTYSRRPEFDGLKYDGYMVGEIRGRKVEASLQRSSSEQDLPSVHITVPVESDIKIDISQEGFISAAEKLTGAKELVVGQNRFDETFYIHTSDKDLLKATLTEDLMEACLRANPTCIYVGKGEVNLTYINGFRDVMSGRWRKIAIDGRNGVKLALSFAEHLEEQKNTSSITTEIATHRPIDILSMFFFTLFAATFAFIVYLILSQVL